MDNGAGLLLSSYQQLVELTEQQLKFVQQEHEEKELEELLQLEEKKKYYQELIDQLLLERDSQVLSPEQLNQVLFLNKQLQALTVNLKEKVSNWYSENSKSMKQVSAQRTTLRTYGGVNYSDVISLYFDQKK